MTETNSLPIDSVDRAILASLATNARRSGSALAADAGVSESTVSQRLRRLHDEGYLRGFHADIDVAKLGMSVQALISIELVKHVREDVDAFRSAGTPLAWRLAFFHTGGGDDYLLHVAARSAAELRDFMLTYLASHPAVAHTETNLVFEHVTGRGLEQLLSD